MKKFTLLAFSFLAFQCLLNAQDNIQDLRSNYNVGDEVTITGIVINGAEMGSSVRYIQDGTAGIAIYPGADWSAWTEPLRGDEMTVTGEITEFNGLLEVGPSLTAVSINSSGNPLPDFEYTDLSDFGEDFEAQLLHLDQVQFQDGGGTFEGNSTYSFLLDGEQGVIYLRSGSALEGQIIPAGEVSLRGILSQFTFDGVGGYQLLPRDLEDIISDSSINLVSKLNQSTHSQTSITVNWLTDTPGTSVVNYGTDQSNLDQTVTGEDGVTYHETTISGLTPGTIYFMSAESSNDDSSVESSVSAFATISESSGDITVYFTGSVQTDAASIEEAYSTGAATNDTIAAYIDRCNSTLDLAVYNNSDPTIMSAIDDAYDRGVQVRYIIQGTNVNAGIQQINDNIPVHERLDDNGSGMHNKFVIIDAEDTDNCVLLTGSTNFTTNGLVEDYNNLIIFQDQSLCRGYRVEFEEMWGGSGAQPVPGNSKFSTDKLNNTPKNYTIGGSPVEVYFSPTDGTSDGIAQAIESTDNDLDFALLVFTRDELAEAVAEEDNLFLVVARGMVEQVSGQGSDFDFLVEEGVDVESHEQQQYQLHHKYCIIDHSAPDSNPTVVTGSHNWSSSAENTNDENTVVVHDARVANLYYQEWLKRWEELTVGVNDIESNWSVRFFPNPADTEVNLFIDNPLFSNLKVQIRDLTGKLVYEDYLSSKKATLDVSSYESGIYTITITDGTYSNSEKLVIQ